MYKNYNVIHLHSDYSNPIFMDSTTKYDMYINKAVELGMKAIAFTEHGNIFSWVKKKQLCDKKKIKYIHGQEFYVTESLEEKKRDNYHVCIYAKNFDGIKELNALSSKAFNRNDGHFYYVPRITFFELITTSKNLIITTACLGGILNKAEKDLQYKFLYFLMQNKDRCFLEAQHHNDVAQKEYNKKLVNLSKEFSIPLIAGTDTHSLNKEHAEARLLLQKAKNISFNDDEGSFDLTFKTYDELFEAFLKQGALSQTEVLQAIQNTNVLADMVEDFNFDKSNKYPKLYENSEDVFKQKVYEGWVKRGVDKLSDFEIDIRKKRIKTEFEVYQKTDSIDFMLYQKYLIDEAQKEGRFQGYGRGSVNGSYIAYLLGITEMDSIKFNLNFFRFLNPDRISLCDIDTDWGEQDREWLKNFLFNSKGLYSAEIITFNSIALKGAIRDMGRALEIPLTEVDAICDGIEIENKEKARRVEYPELFKWVDLVSGVFVSMGTHPSGVLISPIPIDENLGLCSLSTTSHPVTAVNMKEIDGLNFVKLDILGLDNMTAINETCKFAKIERLTPDNMDLLDWKVWESIRENTIGIFQWESESAQRYIKKLFSDETISKIKERNPNINLLELFSFGNGLIRPSGESIREKASQGLFNDNGFEPINEFLKDTIGYLVYQEQIMMWLVQFCGYSMAEADLVRRGIAKKEGTEQLLPVIKQRFIENMKTEYKMDEKMSVNLVEPFIKVILDASDYGFSLNHSSPYSMIGYACGWLRYYYPLEFLTTLLNINKGNIEKTAKIIEYAKTRGINISEIKFRYARGSYFYDKRDNTIYKGMESIKYLNYQIAEDLFVLRDKEFSTFTDLLIEIVENTSLNSRQIEILIKLNFFEEFGGNLKLLNIYTKFAERYKKTYVEKTKITRISEIKEFESLQQDESMDIREQIKCEVETLGYVKTILTHVPNSIYICIGLDTKYTPKLTLSQMCSGEIQMFKVKKALYEDDEIQVFDIIKIRESEKQPKWIRTENGGWAKSDTETEWHLKLWNVVK